MEYRQYHLCRVESNLAFRSFGVDYAGPLLVKNIYSNDKTMYKSYNVFYTCALNRAVHLVPSINAISETFVRSFQRFISRRGMLARNHNFGQWKDIQVEANNKRTFVRRIKWIHIADIFCNPLSLI